MHFTRPIKTAKVWRTYFISPHDSLPAHTTDVRPSAEYYRVLRDIMAKSLEELAKAERERALTPIEKGYLRSLRRECWTPDRTRLVKTEVR